MDLDRRDFFAAGGLGSALLFGCSPADSRTGEALLTAEDASFETAREAFPWAKHQTFLNNAGRHPCGVHSVNAARKYLDYILDGPGQGGMPVGGRDTEEVKQLYGKLINAKASEIVPVQSTLSGENIVAAGLGLHSGKGNVVIDELHYHGGAYIYRKLQEAGLELRVIKQHDWVVPIEEYERQIDGNTKLVSMTLVSNINGYLAESKAVSDIAHANGAYVYSDVVQAAGCIPVDVRAMGIDFCSASTYKWLMGLRGFGLFYVREELQGDVLKPMQFGDRQYANFEYHYFPGSPAGDEPISYQPREGASMYEVGNISAIAAGRATRVAQVHPQVGRRQHLGTRQADVRPLDRRAAETGLSLHHSSGVADADYGLSGRQPRRDAGEAQKGERRCQGEVASDARVAIGFQQSGRH